MRKLYVILLLLLFVKTGVHADTKVEFTVIDGITNSAVKEKIERTLSRILTEVNTAQIEKRTLRFSNLGISDRVESSLSLLWENTPFICADSEITEHCLTTKNGYQIRNIPLMMKPINSTDISDDEYQEAVADFDINGNMESFHVAISMNLYMNVIKSNLELTDLRRRQLILDYVEQFRTAYNLKDINFLNQVFSDDALIITGKVVKQKPMDNIQLPDKIVYTKQGKKEYISKLSQIFRNNKQIKVTFDEIQVMRHASNTNIYGVTLHQGYSADRYHDDGYIFILWDFTDESAPTIHVRTWQPDMFNGRKLDKDDIFGLSDFEIQ